MGELGGISGPMPDDDAVTAAEKSAGYLFSFMAGMTIEPVPAKSAVEEPIMPPKNMLVTTLTWARPPRNCPTIERANSNSRADMPPAFINPPASTNSGSAMSTKRLMPEIMVCGRVSAQAPEK
jgi:hypothetical protein